MESVSGSKNGGAGSVNWKTLLDFHDGSNSQRRARAANKKQQSYRVEHQGATMGPINDKTITKNQTIMNILHRATEHKQAEELSRINYENVNILNQIRRIEMEN